MGDRDGWFQTFNGKEFRLFDPKPEDFDIIEIAHALSMQNRFNGHTTHPYSVAMHSINVGCVLKDWGESREVQFSGLMHDSAEAYIGDLISPLKRGMEKFQIVEMQIMDAMAERFKFIWPLPQIVKKADVTMLMVERRDLLAKPLKPWFEDEDKIELPEWTVHPEIGWRDGRSRFLRRFEELGGLE